MRRFVLALVVTAVALAVPLVLVALTVMLGGWQ